MQIHFGVASLRAEWRGAVGCIGTFDGVHLGHRAVIAEAVRRAQETESPSVLATFDRHPAAVLSPDRVPAPVGTLEQNLDRIRELGVAVAVVLAFDERLASMSADSFLEGILQRSLRVGSLVVGHDFAFGHRRVGTPEWLRERIPTTVVPPLEMGGHRVSSSAIRQAIISGDVECAERWLGRRFRFEGVVVAGEKLGRDLGFRTINLARSTDQVVPADGVYAAIANTSIGRFKAAASIGLRPAVGGKSRTIEAYLLNYPGDSLYGQSVSLDFAARLRDELDFPSRTELRDQIVSDVNQVERILGQSASLGM